MLRMRRKKFSASVVAGYSTSLFVTSLDRLGILAILAVSWMLPLSCLDYHSSVSFAYVCVGRKHRVYIVFSADALLYPCCYKLSELSYPTKIGRRRFLPPPARAHITMSMITCISLCVYVCTPLLLLHRVNDKKAECK